MRGAAAELGKSVVRLVIELEAHRDEGAVDFRTYVSGKLENQNSLAGAKLLTMENPSPASFQGALERRQNWVRGR